MDPKLLAKIRLAIVKGIQATGDDIFDLSQSTEKCYVPVDTGTLKKSGDNLYQPDGTKIVYIAPYAAVVEVGTEGTPIKGNQTLKVGKHTRKPYLNKNGVRVSGTEVSGYSRTYKNSRLVAFEPKLNKFERSPMIYRVVSEEGGRKGQFFLTRAVIKRIGNLVPNIETFLRRI